MNGFSRSRPGVTFVELLLFLSLMALASGAIFGFFILTADSRVRQRARADVQQVAVQLQQSLTYDIRGAERILLPQRGASGTVLALQAASADASPVILTAVSGALLMIRGGNSHVLSPSNIFVDALETENVSYADDQPIVHVMLRLRRSLELPVPETVIRIVDITIALLPTNAPVGDACGCAAPTCTEGVLQWDACVSGACSPVEGMGIVCP